MKDNCYIKLAISTFFFLSTSEKLKLLSSINSLDEFYALTTKDISYIVGRSLRTKVPTVDENKKKLEYILKLLDVYKIDMTHINDLDYPEVLRNIAEPPFMIFSRGKKVGNKQKIGIVGTRKPTTQAIKQTLQTSSELSKMGYVVVSGLAGGIDTFAHRGALDVKGRTIAVLACGVEKIYPQMNARLAMKILEMNGSIISEYPPDTEPLKYRFLARNRIISALSDAVIIMEAPEKSGALSTAGHALEQCKPLLVFENLLDSKQNGGGKKLDANIINDSSEIVNILSTRIEVKTKNFLLEGTYV